MNLNSIAGAAAFALAGALCACSPSTGPALHQPGRVAGAVDIGAEPRSTVLELVLGFRLHDTELIPLRRARRYTPSEFGSMHGPLPSSYEDVVTSLTQRGFEIVRRTDSRTTLTVRADAALIEETFGTRLRRMHDTRGEFRAPTEALTMPAELFGTVETVLGLDDAARWFSHRYAPPPAEPNFSQTSASPLDLQVQYKTDLVPQQGEGETVAILGTGDPPDLVRDISAYITRFGLPTVRSEQYKQVFLGGPNRDDPDFAASEGIENILDAEIVFALAPKASVVHVITATNSPGLFGDGIAFIINNVPQAHAVSVSFGTCERYAPWEVLTLGALFKQARAQGQQWFFASGDDGTNGCRDGQSNTILETDWPASAADVFGVGGTAADQNGDEVAWFGAGGGQSELVPKPAYQIGVGPYPNDGVRNVPDIAALSGSPGVAIVQRNQLSAAQGTSAATPMWAAIWALLDQSQGGQGITNGLERVYQLGAAGIGFNDIVVGYNGQGQTEGYQALPGYDLVTGWGSPDTQALIGNW